MDTVAVDVATEDGVADASLVVPDGEGRHPGVLLYMDAIGLRPTLVGMAERLAGHGYVVLVPNLFYRQGRAPLLTDLPEVIDLHARPELLARMRELIGGLTPAEAVRDSRSYLDFLAAQPRVGAGPVGLVGYCFGGGLAVRAAAAFGARVGAVAGFHAGNLASEALDSPHLLVDRISAELYFGHADNDPSMPREQIQRLDAALAAADVRARSEVYTGAGHGFAISDVAAYRDDAGRRHWKELHTLFERNL